MDQALFKKATLPKLVEFFGTTLGFPLDGVKGKDKVLETIVKYLFLSNEELDSLKKANETKEDQKKRDAEVRAQGRDMAVKDLEHVLSSLWDEQDKLLKKAAKSPPQSRIPVEPVAATDNKITLPPPPVLKQQPNAISIVTNTSKNYVPNGLKRKEAETMFDLP
jgi:hypothetical protein